MHAELAITQVKSRSLMPERNDHCCSWEVVSSPRIQSGFVEELRLQFLISTVLSCLLTLCLSGPVSAAAGNSEPAQAVTTSDPSIPTQELALLLIPLSKTELLIEASGWQEIVKSKAQEIARAEIAVLRENREIDKADAAKAQLEKVAEKVEEAKATGDPDKVAEAQEAAADAINSIHEVDETVDETVQAARKTADMQHEIAAAARQSLD